MSTRPVFLRSYAALLASGIHSPVRRHAWEPDQTVAGVRREQVLTVPCPGFGKLEPADRLAFAVASVLLDGFTDYHADRTGISLGIRNGSIATDKRYLASLESGFPSPALFSATLPSSPTAEVAIHYKLTGPIRVVCGTQALFNCLRLAHSAMYWNKAESMVVIHVTEGRETPAASSGETALALLLSTCTDGVSPQAVIGRPCDPGEEGEAEDVYFQQFIDSLRAGQRATLRSSRGATLLTVEG